MCDLQGEGVLSIGLDHRHVRLDISYSVFKKRLELAVQFHPSSAVSAVFRAQFIEEANI